MKNRDSSTQTQNYALDKLVRPPSRADFGIDDSALSGCGSLSKEILALTKKDGEKLLYRDGHGGI